MTGDEARAQAEALAIGMGITFYVVRSREGDFLPVQMPPKDSEIIAAIDPPRSHEHTLE